VLENLVVLHQKATISHGVKKLVFLSEAVQEHLEEVSGDLLAARAVEFNLALLAQGFVNAGKHREFVIHDDLAGV